MKRYTQYQERVPKDVRVWANGLYELWVADGRKADDVENLIQAVVLGAYVKGRTGVIKAFLD